METKPTELSSFDAEAETEVSPDVPKHLRSPRDTIRTFLDARVRGMSKD